MSADLWRDVMPATGSRTGRRSRAVTWAGVAAGTVLALADGIRLKIGGMPAVLGSFAGFLLTWALTVCVCVLAVRTLTRHRKAIRAYAGRQGTRAARGGWDLARSRWAARGRGDDREHPEHHAGPWLLTVKSKSGKILDSLGNNGRGSSEATATVYDADDLDRRLEAADADPDIETEVRPAPDDYSDGWVDYVTANEDGTVTVDTRRADDRTPAPFWRRAKDGTLPADVDDVIAAPSPETSGGSPSPGNPETGGNTMTVPYSGGGLGRPDADYGSGPGVRQRASGVIGAISQWWSALIDRTRNYDPENDAALLAWMAGEEAGMWKYKDAINAVYDTCVNMHGWDPAAMAAVHLYAEAVSEAAKKMELAQVRFIAYYNLAREHASSGKRLPYRGREITGEG